MRPAEALLGTVAGDPQTRPSLDKRLWMDPVTENPTVGATEVWELYNTTADAHPMHVHEVVFEVVNRQDILVDEASTAWCRFSPSGALQPPEPWETGFKDTVIAYPGQVTRVRAQFNTPGPIRLALPHRGARGQRDDATVSHRPGAARPAAGLTFDIGPRHSERGGRPARSPGLGGGLQSTQSRRNDRLKAAVQLGKP